MTKFSKWPGKKANFLFHTEFFRNYVEDTSLILSNIFIV